VAESRRVLKEVEVGRGWMLQEVGRVGDVAGRTLFFLVCFSWVKYSLFEFDLFLYKKLIYPM
jgi:hypothetical protein